MGSRGFRGDLPVLLNRVHETADRALNSARSTRRPTRSGVQRSGPGFRIAMAEGHVADGLPDHEVPTLTCVPDVAPSATRLVTPPPAAEVG